MILDIVKLAMDSCFFALTYYEINVDVSAEY